MHFRYFTFLALLLSSFQAPSAFAFQRFDPCTNEERKSATSTFIKQCGGTLEIRESNNLHDRVVIVDNSACWVLGQSIKDAAKQKATYLAPLAPDVACQKIEVYRKIWLKSHPI